ncbi:hypothetical protein [Gordonia sp. NPDC003376]
MISPHFVWLGAAISLIGSLRYAVLTLRGKVMPNRVTWFLWAFAPLIGFAAQIADGVGLPAVFLLAVGLGPALILIASFAARSGYWKIGPFDLLCGGASVIALVLWLTFDDPLLAVIAASTADLLAGLPTMRKAWISPETERPVVFLAGIVNGLITLLSLQVWEPITVIFPVQITLMGLTCATIILVRGRVAGGDPTVRPLDTVDQADG